MLRPAGLHGKDKVSRRERWNESPENPMSPGLYGQDFAFARQHLLFVRSRKKCGSKHKAKRTSAGSPVRITGVYFWILGRMGDQARAAAALRGASQEVRGAVGWLHRTTNVFLIGYCMFGVSLRRWALIKKMVWRNSSGSGKLEAPASLPIHS